MLDEDDYADDPTQTAATTGERIEENAIGALDALDGGPRPGEIEDAVEAVEIAADEIRRQQEAIDEAVANMTGSKYGSGGGITELARGADDAYDLLEEIRGMSRSMVEGLIAADVPGEPVAEAEIEIDGTPYRFRLDPMEEAETADPIDQAPNDE